MKDLVFEVKVIGGKLTAILDGNTYPIKKQIKDMGYMWDDFFRFWIKEFDPKDFNDIASEAISTFDLKSANLCASKEASEIIKSAGTMSK